MKKRICMIGNSGGHLEQLKQLKPLERKYELFYISNKCKATENIAYINHYIEAPHKRTRVGTLLGYAVNAVQAFYYILRINPDVIISTGAGIAVPFCLMGKLLKKRIVFIESFARVDSPSRTGKMMYKVADIFIIQHETLRGFYPKALYGGWIY